MRIHRECFRVLAFRLPPSHASFDKHLYSKQQPLAASVGDLLIGGHFCQRHSGEIR